ncbi:alpha/beta fold hydrolase [Variovorax sp. JS1663]|uniref:alpha/beta fold hydrolase n=1 Tax=Variovorax sp. JS1663 TaxID=1851577 RepID=UPI000B341CC3|nr:alpha/beta fold hydrolase [Variovorax sp. JS1663]OUL98654.1 twin-arginine translocation pathway signal [Variovorax sp. JS1663]
MHTRRHLIALSLATTMLAACSSVPSPDERPPIVFVHGNGDSAALWQTTLWRFESNGWPRERLFASDQPFPLARDDDGVVQPGRSSSAESMAFLKAEVERVLKTTGARKVVLIGNSRGGNAIRNYVQNGGGDQVVSHVVLGGNPAHGIWAVKGLREGSEFSGLSPFIQQLNAPKNAAGDEVTPGVKWLTVRSDNNDKYAQPDGVWIGAKGTATNIGFDGPALKGATNIALPRIDHRETSFSPAAFDATWRFLTGEAPRTLQPVPENQVVLSGRVTGLGLDPLNPSSGAFVNNLPLVGARLAIFAVDASTGVRRGQAAWEQTIGQDGRWGPLQAQPATAYEFVLSAPGYATTHIYRSPFPRSSAVVQLRPERMAEADRDAKALVIFTRPRGYFDAERDTMRFDGQTTLPGVPPTGAGVSSTKVRLADDTPRSIAGEFNGERVVGRTWPAGGGALSVLELSY